MSLYGCFIIGGSFPFFKCDSIGRTGREAVSQACLLYTSHEEHHHDHEHEHEHHHHADEVFTSWGIETVHRFSRAELEDLLKLLSMTQDFGTVLRAKGIVQTEEGGWLEFDMVPEETEIRDCKPDYIGRICVIGTELKKDELEKVFAK